MPPTNLPPEDADPLYGDHARSHDDSLYIYPVLSRRAGGISIGVNLNREKFCNFDCVYCQVQRPRPAGGNAAAPSAEPIDLTLLAAELDGALDYVLSGRMFASPRFRHVPAGLRRLNDIALSGDGEPTACPQFVEVVELLAREREARGLDAVKLVLITNATLLHLERVRRGLEILDRNGGEIWAKLDAGTEDYYRRVDRSTVPWPRILDNLRQTAARRPIVIQSLWSRLDGSPPPDAEVDAYCTRLGEIVAAGGQIKLVQIHTIARAPAERLAAPLDREALERLGDVVRRQTGLPVEVYR